MRSSEKPKKTPRGLPLTVPSNARNDVSFSGNEPNKLFRQRDDGKFDEVSFSEGFASRADGRSLAAADLDGDGRLDLVVVNRNSPRVQLYRNETSAGRALQLRFPHHGSAGATVRVRSGGTERVFPVVLARGYATAVDPFVHIGLGEATDAEVEVRWPSGETQALGRLEAGKVWRVSKANPTADAAARAPVGIAFRTPQLAPAPEPIRTRADVEAAEGVTVVPVLSAFCKPCRKHAPALNALHADQPEVLVHGLALHGETADETRSKLKLTFGVKPLGEALTERLEHYGALATPMYLVFGDDAELARIVRTPEALKAVLEELEAKAAPEPVATP